jgi:hypothetical protein
MRNDNFHQMTKRVLVLFFGMSLLISCSNDSQTIDEQSQTESQVESEIVEVYLLNNLNDSRGYCVDVMGYKNDADVDRGLQTHTCYSYQSDISVDQGFDKAKINENEFYLSHFKVCMQAQKIEQSSRLELTNCDKNEKQKFILQNDGRIQPMSDLNLCLTVSESYREGSGGNPVHLIRDLSLQLCNDALSSFQKWSVR